MERWRHDLFLTEQGEIEAGMRESSAAVGLHEKPARSGRKVAAVE